MRARDRGHPEPRHRARPGQHRPGPYRRGRRRRVVPARGASGSRRLLAAILASWALVGIGAAAQAYWSVISTPGDRGAAAATTVNQGATPAASAVLQAVTVSWAASTLASGQAVTGYLVKRYDSGTLAPQTILSSCNGTITALSCVENSVPVGSWVYSVTPLIGANWRGAESVKSAASSWRPRRRSTPSRCRGVRGRLQERQHRVLPRHRGGLVHPHQRA